MSKLRPDAAVTQTDLPAATPGEVPVVIPQDVAAEALDICRVFERAVPSAMLNPEMEALYWRTRKLLTQAGFERSQT